MLNTAIIHYCKYQERCHMEVRNKLFELGFGKNDVEQQLTLLIEEGLLNEERFAIAYAGGKFRIKHWGREKIKQQLKLRKISDYCIKKGLKEIDDEKYLEVLTRLADRKINELRTDRSVLSRKSKLYRYLVQKGYEKDMVLDIVKEIG
jgi:regulatory protein